MSHWCSQELTRGVTHWMTHRTTHRMSQSGGAEVLKEEVIMYSDLSGYSVFSYQLADQSIYSFPLLPYQSCTPTCITCWNSTDVVPQLQMNLNPTRWRRCAKTEIGYSARLRLSRLWQDRGLNSDHFKSSLWSLNLCNGSRPYLQQRGIWCIKPYPIQRVRPGNTPGVILHTLRGIVHTSFAIAHTLQLIIKRSVRPTESGTYRLRTERIKGRNFWGNGGARCRDETGGRNPPREDHSLRIALRSKVQTQKEEQPRIIFIAHNFLIKNYQTPRPPCILMAHGYKLSRRMYVLSPWGYGLPRRGYLLAGPAAREPWMNGIQGCKGFFHGCQVCSWITARTREPCQPSHGRRSTTWALIPWMGDGHPRIMILTYIVEKSNW